MASWNNRSPVDRERARGQRDPPGGPPTVNPDGDRQQAPPALTTRADDPTLVTLVGSDADRIGSASLRGLADLDADASRASSARGAALVARRAEIYGIPSAAFRASGKELVTGGSIGVNRAMSGYR